MSYYSFKITKGKFELAVVSEDKYFVTSQFDKVYRKTVENPQKIKKAKPAKQEVKPESVLKKEEPAIPVEPEKTEELPVKEEAPTETSETTVQKKQEESEKEKEESELPEETKEEPAEEEEPASEDSEVELLKPEEEVVEETETAGEPEPEEKTAEDTEIKEDTEVKEEPAAAEDFQKIIEEKLKEEVETREVSEESGKKETITYYEESDEEKTEDSEEIELAETLRKSFEDEKASGEESPKGAKVYDILQEKLSSIPEEEKSRLNLNRDSVEEKEPSSTLKFKSLDDLLYLKKPQTKLDYLLITSYFLQETEQKEKYSLKQINAKVIPQIKEPIDHSIIHEAVAHGYFEVVPDPDGNSDITEYTITLEGIDYLLNEL